MIFPKLMSLTKQQFVDKVCEVVRKRVPELSVEHTGDLTLHMRITTPTGVLDCTSHLDRLYRELRRNPRKFDEIVNRLVVSIQCSLNFTMDADAIIPVIKSPAWLQAQPAQARSYLWTDPYNKDLLIAYAQYREGLMFGFMENSAVARDEVHDLAMANLRRMSLPITIVGVAGFYTVTARKSWDSSLMLLDELVTLPALDIKGGRVMAVPDRDSFHVVDDSFAPAVFQLGIAATTDYRLGSYPLCPRLFAWRTGKWECLDPKPHDPSQTIVNTTEVAPAEPDGMGGCILPLTIPDPLTSDPRSVYRLFQKLNAYLHAAGSKECCSRFGPPTPKSRCILARIHPSSDPAVKDALRLAEHWLADASVKDTCVALRVEEVSSVSFH